jgi:hypothetical protein
MFAIVPIRSRCTLETGERGTTHVQGSSIRRGKSFSLIGGRRMPIPDHGPYWYTSFSEKLVLLKCSVSLEVCAFIELVSS